MFLSVWLSCFAIVIWLHVVICLQANKEWRVVTHYLEETLVTKQQQTTHQEHLVRLDISMLFVIHV